MSLKSSITRRSFLKGSLLAATATTFAGCSKSDDGSDFIYSSPEDTPEVIYPETTHKGVCRPNCWNSCLLDVTVRNGKVVRTKRARLGENETGLPGLNEQGYYDRICLRGLSHVQRMYSKDRLFYPLMIIDPARRGELDNYKAVSWDEAMTLIAKKLVPILREDSRSLAIMTGSQAYGTITGVGPYGMLAGSLSAINVAANVDMALTVGLHRVFGIDRFPFFDSNELTDIPNANTIVVWGSNVAETQVQSWHFFADALDIVKRRKIKASGKAPKNYNSEKCNMVVIDTMFTTVASKADYFVSINPGTDTVLALCILNEIMYNNEKAYVDFEYLFTDTVAPFLIHPETGEFITEHDIENNNKKGYAVYNKTTRQIVYTSEPAAALGTPYKDCKATTISGMKYTDCEMLNEVEVTLHGKPKQKVKTAYLALKESVKDWTADKCEKYTKVNAQVVKDMAKLYGAPENKPVFTYPGFGTDHYKNGHHFAHALATIACITGNVGKPGASCGLFIPFGFAQGSPSRSTKGAAVGIPYLQFKEVFETHKRPGDSNTVYPPIKAMWFGGGNQISNMGNQKQYFIDSIIKKLDFIVCSEIVMTDTARYADVILPACYWFETIDLISKGNHPFMLLNEKAIEPLGNTISDWRIVQLFAKYLKANGGPDITGDYALSEEGYIKQCVDNSTSFVGGSMDKTINFDKLKRDKAIRYLSNLAGDGPFIFGEDKIYRGNPTGRAEFYATAANIQTASSLFMNLGRQLTAEEVAKERLPYWEKPAEAYVGPDNTPEEKAYIEQYPFAYNQEHARWRVHSQWFHVEWLNEIGGEPFVMINPADANGLQNGDIVKVSNKRGSATVKVVLSHKIQPGQVSIPKGFQRSQFIDGGYNELTSTDYHPATVNQSFYDARVKIEKVN